VGVPSHAHTMSFCPRTTWLPSSRCAAPAGGIGAATLATPHCATGDGSTIKPMADAEPVEAKAPTHSAHRHKRADNVEQCEQKTIMATSRLELPVLTAQLVGIYRSIRP
jgi:hypothetical protein